MYESEKTFDSSKRSRELLDKFGTPYEVLSASQIHDLEPNLAPIFTRGFYQKDSLSISNPERLVKGMVELLVNRGGVYMQFDVSHINIQGNSIELKGQNEKLSADNVVIAAGAWSRSLAMQLGDKIPLDTERGYHLMLPESTQSLLKRPVVNAENSFVLTPMESGLRMTAQLEYGGLDIAADYRKFVSFYPMQNACCLTLILAKNLYGWVSVHQYQTHYRYLVFRAEPTRFFILSGINTLA